MEKQNETVAEQDKNGVFFDVPRKLPYGKDSTFEFVRKNDDKHMVQVTLPPNFIAKDVNGEDVDLSYFRIYCTKDQLLTNMFEGKQTNYFSVLQPKTIQTKDGNVKDYQIHCSKENGHWENPQGVTKEEKGAWVDEGKQVVYVKPEEMKIASQNYKEGQKEYFQARQLQNERNKRDKTQEASLADRAKQATKASEAQEKSAPVHDVQNLGKE